ncbi:hypothetical protein HanIR_Chr04g0203361 [Helianthus annuus]|nr:hypothetical protein HanIR_Chr04g0203361 [Helianthus annuus]
MHYIFYQITQKLYPKYNNPPKTPLTPLHFLKHFPYVKTELKYNIALTINEK